jgi:hypothetical protein
MKKQLQLLLKGRRFLSIVILLGIILACKRQYDDGFVGPEFIPAPAGFTATNFAASPDPVNFSTSKVTFTATFSAKVSYKVILKGLSSGASKTLIGTGWDLSQTTWDGSHDGIYYFRVGDTVEASLIFYDTNLILRDTIHIANVKGSTPKVGLLLNSFESFGPGPTTSAGSLGGFPTNNTQTGFNEVIHIGPANDIRPVEGSKVFTLDGIDYNGNYYMMNTEITGMNPSKFFPAGVSADNLYFNIYIYSYGSPGSRISMNFEELDSYSGAGFISAPINAKANDIYKWILVLPDSPGWYLYSIKYSEIPLSQDANEGMEEIKFMSLINWEVSILWNFLSIQEPIPSLAWIMQPLP